MKFEIIEEGRLSKSEMNQIVGGVLVCTPMYVVSTCVNQLANCSGTYVSCGTNGSNNWACTGPNAPYQGPPFGGGYSTVLNEGDELSTPIDTSSIRDFYLK